MPNSPRSGRGWPGGVLLAAGLFTIWQLREILLLLFGGIIIGVVLKRLRHYVQENTGWPYPVCTLVLLAGLSAAFALLWCVVAPPLMTQTRSLVDEAPAILESLEERVDSHPWLGNWWSRNQDEVAGSVTEHSSEGLSWMMSMLGGMLWSSVGLITALVVIFGIGFYLAVEPRLYTAGLVHLVPQHWEVKTREALHRSGDAITGWLIGQLGSMAVVGVGTALGLWLLGVPHPLPLGILAGVLSFIPNLGPVAAFFPAVLVALAEDPMLAVWTAVLYVAVQVIEGYFVTPYFQKKILAMPPALLLGVQVVAAAWAGLAGLLVAAPLLAALMALTQCLYVETLLGKPAEPPRPERGPRALADSEDAGED